MNLGNSLFHARKRRGLSQEDVAEKLGVSRQTISKWETGETIPDIRQCKRLAVLYQMSLDELIDFDINTAEIQEMIKKSGEKADEKINWTNEWGKKYPILLTYQNKVNIPNYAYRIKTQCWFLKIFYITFGKNAAAQGKPFLSIELSPLRRRRI